MRPPLFALTLALALAGCRDVCEAQWGYYAGGFDRYEDTRPNAVLPTTGIPVQAPAGYDFAELDSQTADVLGCLFGEFTDGVPVGEAAAGCDRPDDAATHGADFMIRVAEDWLPGCSGWQVLPVEAGDDGCLADKGHHGDCPCRWRSGVACPNIVVTTPELGDYRSAVARYITGCRNPWRWARTARCLAP